MQSNYSLLQKPSIVTLLGRQALGKTASEDFVEWAIAELIDGLDTPNLRILAGLSNPLYSPEVDRFFQLTLEDLGIQIPNANVCIWQYIRLLVAQLLTDDIDVVERCDLLYEFCWNAFNDRLNLNDDQKQELRIWQDLHFAWSNRNDFPDFYYPGMTEENFSEIVKLEARKFLTETVD